MTPPRFFVLTSGRTPEEAIDHVESRGHVVVATALTHAASVALYGICEVAGPATEAAEGTD